MDEAVPSLDEETLAKHRAGMSLALEQAEIAAGMDEVAVGAIIKSGELLIGQGHNQNVTNRDPSAHAEIIALRDAGDYEDNYRLTDATIYVTLEPCLMCFTALIHARVKTLVYGASDPKSGFSVFLDDAGLAKFNHTIEIIPGVMKDECVDMIQSFFRNKRERGKRKWMRKKS